MKWFAIRSTPRGELRADAELEQAGIEHFTPTFKRRTLVRYTKGREKVIVIPLITGFTFAQLDYGPFSHHPRVLDDCKHIIGPIRVQGRPAPIIGEGLPRLHQLRLLCDAGAFDQGRLRGQDNRFREGDTVRITAGPLQGICASFRETAGGMRPRAGFVRVMLERMFGSRFETDVQQELVEAA